MRLDDAATVRAQYAREDNLRARQRLYEETTGPDPREVLWEAVASLRPSRVLEVGGGPGELAARMQHELPAEVAFVDLSPRMVELARARGVAAQVGDVQALPFAAASFDTVVAAWMLYHAPDLERGLAEIARVLEPRGTLVAVTNAVDHLRELRELVAHPLGLEGVFNSENGEAHLRRHFSRVDRRDADGVVVVRDRAKLVAYRESLSVDSRAIPDDVELPFLVHRRSSIFVATK